MTPKGSSPVRRGPLEKCPLGQLAGGLSYVWGGESPLRGEGGQVDDMGKGEGCEMHKNLNLSICRQLES